MTRAQEGDSLMMGISSELGVSQHSWGTEAALCEYAAAGPSRAATEPLRGSKGVSELDVGSSVVDQEWLR
eukprot:621259-Hanusia_phi.AAC.1